MTNDPSLSAIAPRFQNLAVTIVDDREDMMDLFAPLLQEAGATVVCVWHKEGEQGSALIQRIIDTNPDIVLLDGNLASEVRGTQLVPTLKDRLPKSKIVGFSSAENLRIGFERVDADGFVFKNTDTPSASINDLAWILE